MKKLIIAATFAFAAIVAQSATIKWGGAVATPDGNGYLTAGTQTALLYSGTAFTGAATKLDSWVMGAAADNGGSIVSMYTLNETEASVASAFSTTYAVDGSVDGYYAVLVLNDAGDLASYYDIGSVSGTTGASAPTDRLVNLDWGGSEYLTSGGYTVSVPEPTSGLLFLLGFAGLALRRRRA